MINLAVEKGGVYLCIPYKHGVYDGIYFLAAL